MTLAPTFLDPTSVAPLRSALPGGMSRRRKAALVVQLALSEGRGLKLSSLPEDVQLDLTRELGAIRLVDRATLRDVAEEFLYSLEDLGLASAGGIDSALSVLGENISPSAAARARSEAARARGIDPWPSVIALPLADLKVIMGQESIEVAAVTLSKLDVAKAAALLAELPGPLARRITFAMSRTAGIQPDAVRRIGAALATEYAVKPERAFASPPVARVGAILNSSKTATREAMLAALDEDDPDFAQDVRRAIFTFRDIPERLAALDVPAILRAVDNETLVIGMSAARAAGGKEAEVADYLLDNISQRLADSIRDEMQGKTSIKRSAAEAAWSEIVAAIRTRAEAGEITLVEEKRGDEPEDETLG